MNTVILTGSSRGLGEAIFNELLSSTCRIISLSRKFTTFQETQAVKRPDTHLYPLDLAVLDSELPLKFLEPFLGNENDSVTFVSNAGVVQPIEGIGNLDVEALKQSILVNVMAPVIITNFLCRMRKQRRFTLKIINISSGAASKPIAGWSLYCATKAAAKMFFDVLALQKEDGIQVNSYDPGVVDTDMQQEIRTSPTDSMPLLEYFVSLKINNQLQSPEAVARKMLAEFAVV